MKKKNNPRHALLLIVFALAGFATAKAYDFAVDGIYYNITDSTALEVEATYATTDYNSYSGSVTMPSTVTYSSQQYTVTGIGDSAFYHSTSLTSIQIADSVTYIGKSALEFCTGLTTVEMPAGLTSIGTYAFYGSYHIDSIAIPAGVTSISNYAFYNCTYLKSAKFAEGSQLTSIGSNAFRYCALRSVEIPVGVTSIGTRAFAYCDDMASVTFAEGSQLTTIGANAFYECTSLTSVEIPTGVTSIGNYAFYECTSLATVTIDENSQLASIGGCAFYKCTSLTSIMLPSTLTSLGSQVFQYCSALTSIRVEATTPPTMKNSLCFSTYSSATLTVPAGSKTAYQETAYWYNFTNIVEYATAFQILGDFNSWTESDDYTLQKNDDGNLYIVVASDRFKSSGYEFQLLGNNGDLLVTDATVEFDKYYDLSVYVSSSSAAAVRSTAGSMTLTSEITADSIAFYMVEVATDTYQLMVQQTDSGTTMGIDATKLTGQSHSVVKEQYYKMNGVEVAKPTEGAKAVYIVVTTYDDGTTTVTKQVR